MASLTLEKDAGTARRGQSGVWVLWEPSTASPTWSPPRVASGGSFCPIPLSEPAAAVVATPSVGDADASIVSSPAGQSTREGTEEIETDEPLALPTTAAEPVPPGRLFTASAVAARTKGPGKCTKSRRSGPQGTPPHPQI